mmetsp:Transcript_19773/g.32413  ORF Transcript_19773/g.32413 Transcript_19773/m.32413 type:complete len:202 (+) Transcript_19773:888-1493(+)
MATGVNSCRVSITSPIAKIWGTLVRSSFTAILPLFKVTTPAASRFIPATSACRPVANNTVSKASVVTISFVPTLTNVTSIWPEGSLTNCEGVTSYINLVPISAISDATFSEHCLSKPRNTIDRTATVVGYPSSVRNPATSRLTYPPPIQRVFPGALFKEKISSLVIASSSAPGTSVGIVGRPPTAITMYFAVIVFSSPCRE